MAKVDNSLYYALAGISFVLLAAPFAISGGIFLLLKWLGLALSWTEFGLASLIFGFLLVLAHPTLRKMAWAWYAGVTGMK